MRGRVMLACPVVRPPGSAVSTLLIRGMHFRVGVRWAAAVASTAATSAATAASCAVGSAGDRSASACAGGSRLPRAVRGLTQQCLAAPPPSGEQLQSGVGLPIMRVGYLDGTEE